MLLAHHITSQTWPTNDVSSPISPSSPHWDVTALYKVAAGHRLQGVHHIGNQRGGCKLPRDCYANHCEINSNVLFNQHNGKERHELCSILVEADHKVVYEREDERYRNILNDIPR